MGNDLNILILSCGTRNKIVQYFRKELGQLGKVLATDCSELAPALYEADQYFIVPRMDEEGYIEHILSICKDNNIKLIFSLIDPELSLLAERKQDFIKIGTTPIISDFNVVEMCFDKYRMYQFLIEHGYKTVRSYINKNEFYEDVQKGLIDYPVFVKPVRGSASINISKVTSQQEIEQLFSMYDNLMIQQFMSGSEFGADVYIDMLSKEPVAIFTKEKLKMRAGETDKSVSIKDAALFELVSRFSKELGAIGIIDIDLFKVDGDYYISEVNPRFGGGYPHAYESGVNVPQMIINNGLGKENDNVIGQYNKDIYMMKYSEVKIWGNIK